MLAHQRLGARTLAALERLDDGVVLAVRETQHVVHLFQVALVEREGLRSGEGNTAVPSQRLGQQRTAGFRENEAMEALVHLGIKPFVIFLDVALVEDGIAVFEASPQLPQQRLRGSPLRYPS